MRRNDLPAGPNPQVAFGTLIFGAAALLEAGLKLLRTVAGNGFSVFESAVVEVEKD